MRSLIGYAVLAVVGLFALRLLFSLLGFVVSLAVTVLVWAAIGFGIYLLIRIFSPGTAAKVKETVTGRAG